ncbi:amidohydrolase family protein [Mesorhizobium sp. 1B3]|uniref:amidohydrolase family protein n=1 Tax=Mesorhizobium sp. 1B3 TaxID=3243599 RepID=UPI003D9588B7
MPIYSGPIIDAHHHLWDLDLHRHPWLDAAAAQRGGLGDLEPLRRNYLSEDYRRDAARHAVVATVHVEAGWRSDDSLGETRWLETLDKSTGVPARYVAHVPLASPHAAELIDAQAAFDRVVGIRDILSWDPDPARRFAARDGIMDESAWRASLALLARRDLVFDLMAFPRQLAAAARLAADFPDQPFVVNHCGSPIDRDEEGMRRWREGLAILSRRENVAIKISDLVAYDHDWTLDSLRPVVMHCIDCFGPERAMFGSDFPVAGLHATFDEVYDSFKEITAGFSEAEQRALFFGTAQRIYRVDTSSSGGLAT